MEILNNVEALGSDFKMGVGFLWKSGQTAPVGDGGPMSEYPVQLWEEHNQPFN